MFNCTAHFACEVHNLAAHPIISKEDKITPAARYVHTMYFSSFLLSNDYLVMIMTKVQKGAHSIGLVGLPVLKSLYLVIMRVY